MSDWSAVPVVEASVRATGQNYLFATFQVPFVDLRPLLRESRGRLVAPTWPDARTGVEFLRGAGVVRSRPRGPIQDWDGESAYVDAARLFSHELEQGADAWKPIYRRLVGSQLCYRLDVGAKLVRRRPLAPLEGNPLYSATGPVRSSGRSNNRDEVELPLLHDLVRSTVRVGGRSQELSALGPALRKPIWAATTSHAAIGDGAVWRLGIGAPMVLSEYLDPRITSGDYVLQTSSIRAATRTPAYVIRHDGKSPQELRRIRTALWRLNSELEVLREIARTWTSHPEMFDHARLYDYLNLSTKYLARKRRGGIETGPLSAIHNQLDAFPGTELQQLVEMTAKVSKGIKRRLEMVIEGAHEDLSDRSTSTAPQKAVVIKQTTRNKFVFQRSSSGVFGSDHQIHL